MRILNRFQKFSKRSSAEERVSLDEHSPWWGEHRSRYHFAGRFVRSAEVLDVACGTGFGSKILAHAGALSVVGLDYSPEAIRTASSDPAPDSAFCRGDATLMPFRSSSFDTVVSFETLEHLRDDQLFLQEVKRVLRADGVLILSTPNALHTRPIEGVPVNPFHVREYTHNDLENLLSSTFGSVEMLGQIVHPRFRVMPFWQRKEDLPLGIRARVAVVAWKAAHRLPFAIKDGAARLVHNRGFYPGEYDFLYERELTRAHVLVALCRL